MKNDSLTALETELKPENFSVPIAKSARVALKMRLDLLFHSGSMWMPGMDDLRNLVKRRIADIDEFERMLNKK